MIAAALLACALNVAPITLNAVVHVESGGNSLALNVNRWNGPQPRATTTEQAASIAEAFIARGYSVDLGLMQVNSRNLVALGMTVDQVLQPCANIRAGARILTADYDAAVQRLGEGQHAMQAALSAYNTGTFWRGFSNGYVAKYYAHAVPAVAPAVIATPANPFTADTQIYSRETVNVRVD